MSRKPLSTTVAFLTALLLSHASPALAQSATRDRFSDIAPGTTRNQYRFPAYMSVDPRLARNVRLGGNHRLMLIWEAFNVLNRPHYNVLNNTLYTAAGTTLRVNPPFGQKTSQLDPRIMQLAVKYTF